jgi:hypothetical protein
MLTKCWVCKGKVSMSAKSCPHCGEQNPLKVECSGQSLVLGKKCQNYIYVNGDTYLTEFYCADCKKKDLPGGLGLFDK